MIKIVISSRSTQINGTCCKSHFSTLPKFFTQLQHFIWTTAKLTISNLKPPADLSSELKQSLTDPLSVNFNFLSAYSNMD